MPAGWWGEVLEMCPNGLEGQDSMGVMRGAKVQVLVVPAGKPAWAKTMKRWLRLLAKMLLNNPSAGSWFQRGLILAVEGHLGE